MPVLHAPDSPYSQEMVKHEAQYSAYGPGLRPYVYRPYPMMMHLAGRPANGMGVDEIIETRIVDDDDQEGIARGQGFRPTPLEALSVFAKDEFAIAELAANVNYNDRGMTPKAQAEAELVKANAGGHLGAIPEAPIRRRVSKEDPSKRVKG